MEDTILDICRCIVDVGRSAGDLYCFVPIEYPDPTPLFEGKGMTAEEALTPVKFEQFAVFGKEPPEGWWVADIWNCTNEEKSEHIHMMRPLMNRLAMALGD